MNKHLRASANYKSYGQVAAFQAGESVEVSIQPRGSMASACAGTLADGVHASATAAAGLAILLNLL